MPANTSSDQPLLFFRCGALVLPVYTLRGADQAQGFMGFQRLPEHYGLLFPDVTGHRFHMRTVGAPLLAVGLESTGEGWVVCSARLWQPEGECSFRGSSVLECSPVHRAAFQVGAPVTLVPREEVDVDLRLA